MRAAVRPNRDKFLLSCNELACSKSYLKMAATLQILPSDFTTSIFSFRSHIPRFKVRVNRLWQTLLIVASLAVQMEKRREKMQIKRQSYHVCFGNELNFTILFAYLFLRKSFFVHKMKFMYIFNRQEKSETSWKDTGKLLDGRKRFLRACKSKDIFAQILLNSRKFFIKSEAQRKNLCAVIFSLRHIF